MTIVLLRCCTPLPGRGEAGFRAGLRVQEGPHPTKVNNRLTKVNRILTKTGCDSGNLGVTADTGSE